MTLDEFREKCCRLCGTQRCTGDGECLNSCPHYHREVLGEADYEDPAMKAVREYLENRIAESPVNERKQPNCDNCIWHPSGIAEGISHERLREITDAERDGRCFVLPCKVGTRVWVIGQNCDLCRDMYAEEPCLFGSCEYKEVFESVFGYGMIDNFGKTVFLTREEAEEALENEG